MHWRSLAFGIFTLSGIALCIGPANAVVPMPPEPTIAGHQVLWDEMGGLATVMIPATNSGHEAIVEKIQAAIKEAGLTACDIHTPDVLTIMRRVEYHWNFVGTREDPVVWPVFVDRTVADPDRKPGIHGASKIVIDFPGYEEQPPAGGMLVFDAHAGKDKVETLSCEFSMNNIVEVDVTAKLGDRLSQRQEDQYGIHWTLAPPDDHTWPEGAKAQLTLSRQLIWLVSITKASDTTSVWPWPSQGRQSALTITIHVPAKSEPR
jgi:hypothetical protein